MVVDRIQLPFAGQRRENVELTGDHSVSSRDQVLIGLPIDETKKRDDENRKHAGHCQRTLKGVRTYDLRLTHRVSPPGFPGQRIQRRVATGHLSAMVRCEE